MSDAPQLKPYRFQPGQSGNPKGGPLRLPPALRQARRENMAALIGLVHKYVGMTEEQAKDRLQGPDSLQIEEMIQGQISKAKEGDSRAFQFIVEVMCGKIPESDDATPTEDMTTQEKIEVMEKGLAVLRAKANGS